MGKIVEKYMRPLLPAGAAAGGTDEAGLCPIEKVIFTLDVEYLIPGMGAR